MKFIIVRKKQPVKRLRKKNVTDLDAELDLIVGVTEDYLMSVKS